MTNSVKYSFLIWINCKLVRFLKAILIGSRSNCGSNCGNKQILKKAVDYWTSLPFQKPKTTSGTKTEKPLVFFTKTENQMLKNEKSANRNDHQNRKTEVFCNKNRKTDLKNSQNRKTENPNAPLNTEKYFLVTVNNFTNSTNMSRMNDRI